MSRDPCKAGGEPCAVGVDVGGTSVRLGVVSASGGLLPETLREFDPRSGADAATILGLFAEALADALAHDPVGIGIGFPGPFDYDRGICLIRGLGKFDALYGVDVGDELRRRLRLPPGTPIRFINDATAFALGEARFGAARPFRRVLVLTLGTGCGSAFLVDGRIVTEGEGVPPNGWVYPLLYRGQRLDDLLSRRGILRLWDEACEEARGGPLADPYDVVDLARWAERGDAAATETWRRFGRIAAQALVPVIRSFGPEALVFGGKIAKSLHLFGASFRETLHRAGSSCLVIPAADVENAAVKGAAAVAFG